FHVRTVRVDNLEIGAFRKENILAAITPSGYRLPIRLPKRTRRSYVLLGWTVFASWLTCIDYSSRTITLYSLKYDVEQLRRSSNDINLNLSPADAFGGQSC